MQRLGVFAKYWGRGQVKTRLAATEGADRATGMYRAFLDSTLARFGLPAWNPVVAFTPAERREDFDNFVPTPWHVEPQVEGDLGARLRHFFQATLDNGYQQVVVIGSDSPNLPVNFVADAFAALQEVPVVLGPSDDGGYYLIGLNSPASELFDNVDWGTAAVWSQTVEHLQSHRIPFVQLPAWYDVDDRESLQRLFCDLKEGSSVDNPLRTLQEYLVSVSVAHKPTNGDEPD